MTMVRSFGSVCVLIALSAGEACPVFQRSVVIRGLLGTPEKIVRMSRSEAAIGVLPSAWMLAPAPTTGRALSSTANVPSCNSV